MGKGDLALIFPIPGKTQVDSCRERNGHRHNFSFQRSTIACCSSLQVHQDQQNHLHYHLSFTADVERKNKQSENHHNICLLLCMVSHSICLVLVGGERQRWLDQGQVINYFQSNYNKILFGITLDWFCVSSLLYC